MIKLIVVFIFPKINGKQTFITQISKITYKIRKKEN